MTWAMLANALLGQEMWVEHRDFPGGPSAYFAANSSVWYNVVGSAADAFADFMGDALLLYRCYIIWNSKKIIILPFLMFLASTALSIIAVVQSALPSSSFFETQTIVFAVPWISLTCSLNFVLTALIASRLLWVRREMIRVMPKEVASVYTGLVAILVESALPFTVLGIIFAVLLGKNLIISVAFSLVWGYYVGIAPQLIILRVAMGRAWSKDTFASASTGIDFSQGGNRSEHTQSTFNTHNRRQVQSEKTSSRPDAAASEHSRETLVKEQHIV